MGGLIGMEQFLSLFGNVTLSGVVTLGLAIAFVVFCGKKVADYLKKKWEAEQKKDVDIKECLDQVKKYPEYRKQSIAVQNKLEGEIQELRNSQEVLKETQNEIKETIVKHNEEFKKRERNKLRDRLLQSYRYYSAKGEWTEMEAEAFWDLFKDYEDAGGNGYVHTVVQPGMNRLKVTKITE